MKSALRLLLPLLLLLTILQASHALALTPPAYEFLYNPGEQQNFIFNIRNDGLPTYINVTVRGPLGSTAKISDNYFFLKGGESKNVEIKSAVPEIKTPGKQITEVFFTQVAPKLYGRPQGMSATVSIVGMLITRVPFKEKYAEISLGTSNVRRGDKAFFTVGFSNFGSQLINKVSGSIKIFDEQNSTSATVPLTDIVSLASMATDTMYAEFDTPSMSAGRYSATAFVDYDGAKLSDTKEFRITDVLLDILEISAPDITEGQIAKATITVQNKWGESIGAFAQLYLKDEQSATVAEAVTPTTKILPFETSKLAAYINTNNLPAGIYTLDVIVTYAEKEAKGHAKLVIGTKQAPPKKFEFNYAYAVLAAIIAVLLVLLKVRKKHG